MPNRYFEYYVVRIVMCAAFLMISFFGVKIIHDIYYNHTYSDIIASADTMNLSLQDTINETNDAYKLTKMAIVLTDSEKPDLAISAAKKATSINQGYRDAWIALGYAYLKKNNAQSALDALKTAEKIDPIYPKIFELEAEAYNGLGQKDLAGKAREKEKYLEEHDRNGSE